jgi:CheY-like chemotaxis protein
MKKILVVDDTQEVADMVAQYLQVKGYEVYVAYSAEEGLRLLKKHGPLPEDLFDLLITDNQMPGMNGEELVMKVREDYPTIKIIMMSSDIPASETQLYYFIKKPFDPLDLHQVIRDILID